MLENQNKQWSSRFGFIMALVGAAVGLGNIWRFPYIMGMQGGAVFLFVYILMVVVLGYTLMSAEISLGRHSQMNILSTFKSKKRNFVLIGFICISIYFFVASFYSVVGGWLMKYLFGYITGGGFVQSEDYANTFQNFISHPIIPLLFNLIFIGIVAVILIFGVKNGIEKVSKILMPALFVMLIFIMIVSLCMSGALEGLTFFFVPNIERINQTGGISGIIVAAMGQAFFSLNIGVGVHIVYGSYLKKHVNIKKNTAYICILDTLVAILAGLAILPAVFSVGLEPSSGPGLIFITLPAVFASLGGFGIFIGAVFFLLTFFAAITSAFSLFEPLIALLIDKFKMRRWIASIIVASVIFISSTLVSLSQTGLFGNIDLITILDTITTTILIPISAILICLYISISWKTKNAAIEYNCGCEKENLFIKVWKINIAYIVPLLIFTIFIFGIINLF